MADPSLSSQEQEFLGKRAGHTSDAALQIHQGRMTEDVDVRETLAAGAVNSRHPEEGLDGHINEMFSGSRHVSISGGAMINAQRVTIYQEQSTSHSQSSGSQRREDMISETLHSEPQPSHLSLNRGLHNRSQKSCHVYWRNLIVKERGSPLWHPEPNSYPGVYKQQGVSIGDVGLLLPSGGFHFLFNIYHPADHPINGGRVPEGFMPLDPPIDPFDIDKEDVKGVDSWYASQSILASCEEANGELLFESSAEEGAILTLPHGSHSEDLIAIRGLRKYVGENLQRWYRYVAIDRQYEVDNGDIRVVTGWDKTSRWGVAAFCSSLNSVRLTFHPADGLARSYRWQHSGSLDSRTGPRDDTVASTTMQYDSPAPKNQCVFVRTLNATFREDFWVVLNQKSFVNVDNNSGGLKFLDDQDNPPMSLIGTRHTTSHQAQYGGPHTTKFQTSTDRSRAMMPHPSRKLNDLLWQLVPQDIRSTATVMISHDNDWILVLNHDDSILPESQELYDRIVALNASMINEEGVIALHFPEQTSQIWDNMSLISESETEETQSYTMISDDSESETEATIISISDGSDINKSDSRGLKLRNFSSQEKYRTEENYNINEFETIVNACESESGAPEFLLYSETSYNHALAINKFPLPSPSEYFDEITMDIQSNDTSAVKRIPVWDISLKNGGIATPSSEIKQLFGKSSAVSVSSKDVLNASKREGKRPAKFFCTFNGCNASFTRNVGLKSHYKSHLGVMDLECPFCNIRTTRSLEAHKKRCKHNPGRNPSSSYGKSRMKRTNAGSRTGEGTSKLSAETKIDRVATKSMKVPLTSGNPFSPEEVGFDNATTASRVLGIDGLPPINYLSIYNTEVESGSGEALLLHGSADRYYLSEITREMEKVAVLEK